MVDAIDNMLAHASFGAVFLTVWLMLGAATFAFSVLVGFLVRRPRPGHWLAPIGPGYRPRWDYGGMPIPMDGMPIVLRPL